MNSRNRFDVVRVVGMFFVVQRINSRNRVGVVVGVVFFFKYRVSLLLSSLWKLIIFVSNLFLVKMRFTPRIISLHRSSFFNVHSQLTNETI